MSNNMRRVLIQIYLITFSMMLGAYAHRIMASRDQYSADRLVIAVILIAVMVIIAVAITGEYDD